MRLTQKEKKPIIMQNGKVMDIPPEGTLGLLALGAVGIRAWREKIGNPLWLVKQNKLETEKKKRDYE